MPRSVVVDASPLIFLSSAGLIELLHRVDWDVLVPAAVRAEILRRGADDLTARALDSAPWLRAVGPVETPSDTLDLDLGPGESEVLAIALSYRDSLVVSDDRAARKAARDLGLRVAGTLAIVLAAKSAGRIASARSVVDRLRRDGMYLSDRVVERALREVDE